MPGTMPPRELPRVRYRALFAAGKVACGIFALGALATMVRAIRAATSDFPFFSLALGRMWWAVAVGATACLAVGVAIQVAQHPARRLLSFALLAGVVTLLDSSLGLPGSPTLAKLGVLRMLAFFSGLAGIMAILWYFAARATELLERRRKVRGDN